MHRSSSAPKMSQVTPMYNNYNSYFPGLHNQPGLNYYYPHNPQHQHQHQQQQQQQQQDPQQQQQHGHKMSKTSEGAVAIIICNIRYSDGRTHCLYNTLMNYYILMNNGPK